VQRFLDYCIRRVGVKVGQCSCHDLQCPKVIGFGLHALLSLSHFPNAMNSRSCTPSHTGCFIIGEHNVGQLGGTYGQLQEQWYEAMATHHLGNCTIGRKIPEVTHVLLQGVRSVSFRPAPSHQKRIINQLSPSEIAPEIEKSMCLRENHSRT
jgi:hypothetical protein